MILEAFVVGLTQVFVWPNFGLMLAGVVVGSVVGLLPGLGGAATVALLLPLTSSMTPIQAFALLVSTLAVASTTGDITSILFGVPGEATAAATTMDGYPMARRGEGERALGGSLMSSLIGTIVGAFALALAVPVAAPLMRALASPELFMLTVLGITFMAPLITANRVKGLIAGGVGLFLATIGLDPIEATPRFTLNSSFLWDGIGLLPVTLGLLAIPEAVTMAGSRRIAANTPANLGSSLKGLKDALQHWRLVIRCSVLGTFIGLLPGIGAGVAQWVAYGHAVQGSPDKARFGHGEIEGVLAPSAANNATLGGALLPTLALGIPGSVGTAVLLGALMFKGVVPGPQMLAPESQGGQLTLVFSLVWLMVVANLIAVAICFLGLNRLARLAILRASLLVPCILALICLGAFAENGAREDLLVLVLFGALGCTMVRLDWPRAPLLLGLVLGPLAENRLFLSAAVYGVGWLTRPGVLLIAVLIAMSLAIPVRRLGAGRAEKLGKAHEFRYEAPFSLSIALALAAALRHTREFSPRAALFPCLILVPTLALSLFEIGRLFRDKANNRSNPVQFRAGPPHNGVREGALVFTWFTGIVCAIWLFGFVVAVPFWMFLYLVLASRERWDVALAVSASAFLFIHVVMQRTFLVAFPEGVLLGLRF